MKTAIRTVAITIALALATTAGSALSQSSSDTHMKHGGSGMPHHGAHHGHETGRVETNLDPVTRAFAEVNARMHANMDIPFSGDADVDFAKGMIPHHQGAIDMARIVLEHGKDPEIRRLASGIIAAQEKEIAILQNWLNKRGR